MKYKEIRSELNTGDLVLFRGRGFASTVILWVCSIFRLKFTKYSHIGMVVRHSNRILLFEAVPSGVHLVALSDALAKYDGDTWIRKLKGERTVSMIINLDKFIHNTVGKPYESDLLELLGAATPWHIGKEDYSDWFCMELVAAVYQLWELMPRIPGAKEYEPDDGKVGGAFDKELALFSDPSDVNRTYCLTTEILIEKQEIIKCR
jgi:uncharacterized protein YycO